LPENNKKTHQKKVLDESIKKKNNAPVIKTRNGVFQNFDTPTPVPLKIKNGGKKGSGGKNQPR